ncbi:hypothetical protein G9P44_005980 [Scheffersomyces stipitis]|nr:hypothetical protein G9P44_005980 [Scheffersomyces stipitis]
MSFRDAFQSYIDHPEKHSDLVLYHDEHVIIIRDLFPKSVRHYLVIPRSTALTHVHPLDVFNRNYKDFTGEELYELIGTYVEKAKEMIIEDIDKSLGNHPNNKLKLAEFKNKFIKSGIHSIPSLRNLHIHVITQDFFSIRMKHKKHYNSFTTKFFVEFDKLNPNYNAGYCKLRSGTSDKYDDYDSDSVHSSESDEDVIVIKNVRNEAVLNDIIKSTPLQCTICGATFGNKFQKLKEHMEEEFTKKYSSFEGYDVNKLIKSQI